MVLDDAAPALPTSVAETLLTAASGNPLALVELPRGLSDEERRGAALLPDPVPVAARVESAFLARVRELSPGGRAALLLAAASTSGRLDAVAEPDALAEAERAGLVRVADGRVRFRHPLVRAAAYHAATSAERRAAHASLAAALAAADDADEHAWHVAAACPGLDEGVAALLDETAARAERRGSPAAQARALQRAADLTPQRAVRFDRLLRASRAALAAGQATLAQRLLDDASARADTLLERADVAWVRCDIDASAWDEQFATMLALADAVAPLDARRAARLTHRAADYLSDACRHDEAHALRARGDHRRRRAAARSARRADRARVHRHRGAARRRRRGVRAAGARRPAHGLRWRPGSAALRRRGRSMFAEHPDARQRIDALVERMRRDGVVMGLCDALAVLASWEIRFERAPRTRRQAGRTPARSRSAAGGRSPPRRASRTSRPSSGARRTAPGTRRASWPWRCPTRASSAPGRTRPWARSRGAGRHDDRRRGAGAGGGPGRADDEPALPDVETDLAEALIRAGRVEEAAAILDDVEQRARLAGSQRVLRRAARCRLLLARDDAIDGAYAEAAAFDGNTLERARPPSPTASGCAVRGGASRPGEPPCGCGRVRGRGRRRLGRSGTPRARRERRRAAPARGVGRGGADAAGVESAALVGEGQDEPRGRGCAVISPKTVELHLTRVFRELGCRLEDGTGPARTPRTAGGPAERV